MSCVPYSSRLVHDNCFQVFIWMKQFALACSFSLGKRLSLNHCLFLWSFFLWHLIIYWWDVRAWLQVTAMSCISTDFGLCKWLVTWCLTWEGTTVCRLSCVLTSLEKRSLFSLSSCSLLLAARVTCPWELFIMSATDDSAGVVKMLNWFCSYIYLKLLHSSAAGSLYDECFVNSVKMTVCCCFVFDMCKC